MLGCAMEVVGTPVQPPDEHHGLPGHDPSRHDCRSTLGGEVRGSRFGDEVEGLIEAAPLDEPDHGTPADLRIGWVESTSTAPEPVRGPPVRAVQHEQRNTIECLSKIDRSAERMRHEVVVGSAQIANHHGRPLPLWAEQHEHLLPHVVADSPVCAMRSEVGKGRPAPGVDESGDVDIGTPCEL